MVEKPVVGMKVRLNDRGMRIIQGLRSWVEVEAAKCMTIVAVDKQSGFCTIDVSGPLGKYMLTNEDVDEIYD